LYNQFEFHDRKCSLFKLNYSTTENETIGVALHKTHGREERPYNLYSTKEPTFDFLVTLHPRDGILIIPYAEIPSNPNWPGYLADPAQFDWSSGWKNRWDLLGHDELRGKSLESRVIPTKSQLPKLSSETLNRLSTLHIV